MATLKDITKLPLAESAEGVNLIVNDNGAAKQIAASAVGGTKITSPAQIGQTIIVKAVNEKGVPIEWECIDVVSELIIVADVNYNIISAPDKLYEKIQNMFNNNKFSHIFVHHYDIEGNLYIRQTQAMFVSDNHFYLQVWGAYGLDIYADGKIEYYDLG